METLILIMSIICFLWSFWNLLAKVTVNSLLMLLLWKLTALLGVLIPIVYWIKLLNIF